MNQLLSEVFDRGLAKGEKKLSPVDLELFLIWDFIIENEMSGLSGYLYNRVALPGRIDAAAHALRKYEVEPLAKVAEELSRRFRSWKNSDDDAWEPWEDALARHISIGRMQQLEDQLSRAAATGYGLAESKLKHLVSAAKAPPRRSAPRKAAKKPKSPKKA